MRKRISPATIIAGLALFFSLAGAGFAAQHFLITSRQQIAPWVRAELRGARGPRGFTGPQGPQGSAATTAAIRYDTASDTVIVPAGQEANDVVQCPSKHATGGGFDVPDGVSVSRSRPLDSPSGWAFTARNTTDAAQRVDFWVVCAA